MRPEAAPALANMSAPPRSVVKMPRLAVPAATGGDSVPVGPGGGQRVSHALCLAQVDLGRAVGAAIGRAMGSPVLTAPLALARWLVAIADARAAGAPVGRCPALDAAIGRVDVLSEPAVVAALTEVLQALPWPAWVPAVCLVRSLGADIARGFELEPPDPPRHAVADPLLAARLASAIRGPVFLRDAAPALSCLLTLNRPPVPSGCWDLWLPLRPGAAAPGASS